MSTTNVLCIMDGFGFAPKSPNNVPYLAKMPNFRSLLKDGWWTTLDADGEFVGQESGLVGNSEVGHMNIGGLKLVAQLSYQVTESAKKSFDLDSKASPEQLFDPKMLLKKYWESLPTTKTVHLVGLFSTGTIHSDLRHWAGAIEAAGKAGAQKIVLHLITDGRDSDRQSLVATWDFFIENYNNQLSNFAQIVYLGSVGGRFYAMDRDKNWDRVIKGVLPMISYNQTISLEVPTQVSSDFSTKLKSEFELELDFNKSKSKIYNTGSVLENSSKNLTNISFWLHKITQTLSYPFNNFDEAILPSQIFYNGEMEERTAGFDENDTVWLLNFRTDRMKQLTKMICEVNKILQLNLLILGMNDYGSGQEQILSQDLSEYDASSSNYYPVFKNKPVENTLAETISKMGKSQLHIAETEKYNHVTYFLNGGQNKKSEREDWVVIDSNKVISHAEKPAMKAVEITDYILKDGLGKYDYIIVNYANPDMVGHTGDIEASITAMEVLDEQLGRLIEKAKQDGHKIIFTADHGNIEMVGDYEVNGKKLTDTEHNANFVPCILVDTKFDSSTLLDKINSISANENIIFDQDLVSEVLGEHNSINLTDQNSWLELKNIPTPKLGLWYAGLIFLCM